MKLMIYVFIYKLLIFRFIIIIIVIVTLFSQKVLNALRKTDFFKK